MNNMNLGTCDRHHGAHHRTSECRNFQKIAPRFTPQVAERIRDNAYHDGNITYQESAEKKSNIENAGYSDKGNDKGSERDPS